MDVYPGKPGSIHLAALPEAVKEVVVLLEPMSLVEKGAIKAYVEVNGRL